MPDKMAITVFSGSVDRLTGMAILVSGAVALDMEVEIFLQLWGVYAFKKDVIRENHHFSEFKELVQKVAERIKELKLPTWFELLKQAREMGNVKIYACSTACKIWNVTKDDLALHRHALPASPLHRVHDYAAREDGDFRHEEIHEDG